MIRRGVVSVVFASLIGLAGCTQAPPPPPPEPVADAPADIEALNTARKAFMAAYEAGDANAIGNLYTADAISEPNHQPALEGRDAIVASLTKMFEQVSVKPQLETDETRTLGNVGLDRGHYTMTVTPKAGAPPTTSQGRYLVIYVKEADGNWRVWRDIDNAAMPPAAPDAPAAADAK